MNIGTQIMTFSLQLNFELPIWLIIIKCKLHLASETYSVLDGSIQQYYFANVFRIAILERIRTECSRRRNRGEFTLNNSRANKQNTHELETKRHRIFRMEVITFKYCFKTIC